VHEKGMSLEIANTVFGGSRIGGLFATFLMGLVLDRFNLKIILITILLVTGASTVIIAITTDFWLLVSMLVIQATISVTFFPTAITTISRLTHIAERSTFMGLTLAISSIFGAGLTPVIMGFVADQWNFSIGIFFMGLLAVVSCLLINKLSLFKTAPSG
jgi:MFS family permease